MEADSFEKALDDYLQAQDYDNIHEAIYQFARSAFCAGWKAAKNDSAVMADIIILDLKKIHLKKPHRKPMRLCAF